MQITATLTGLPPGQHAFHIHEVGTCEPPFESAGGHFNPTGKRHGKDNPQGPHLGDLPNLDVPQSGRVKTEMTLKGVTLADGRRITVLGGWAAGSDRERQFLRTIHTSACKRFGTVLGPDYNAAHRDHLHVEMGGGSYCR